MRITLYCVGQTKSHEIRALCAEYEKRLKAFCEFEVKFLRPYTLSANPSDSEIRTALEAEAEEILRCLDQKPGAYRTALCVEGKELTSLEFSSLIEMKMQSFSEFVFLIGSSYGLSERVKVACRTRLSLSRMTLPHELCRLVFSEQLYRAFSIQKNGSYHK